MGASKDIEREFAAMLYIQQGLTQKEIAARCKVSEKTVGKWKDADKWDKQKRSFMVVREEQITDLYEKLEKLNEHIKNTQDNIVSVKDVDAISKLTASIRNLETETSVAEIIDVAKHYIDFVKAFDLDFAKQVTEYFTLFIQDKLK